jgi:pimeloyl-ACP methyl ester carboxylesterase
MIGWIAGGLLLLLVVAALGLWLAYRAPDVSYAALERKFARPASHYADLGNGLRIHYLDEGKADAPPVVLIHGYGDNAFSWDGWAKRLGADHRVLVVDMPGHGLTRAPAGFIAAPDKLAEAIAAWAGKIGLKPYAVAGNSLGGAVAWILAVKHPEQVSSLILVDAAGWPSPPSKDPPPLAFRIMQYKVGRDLIASIDSTPLIREGLRKDVGDKAVITEPFIARWAKLQRAPGHRQILMSLGAGDIVASNALLSTIKVPTLILWGEIDPIIPVSSAQKFKDAIPQAEMMLYPGIGHLPQIENPARSAADAADFLARHPPG